MPPACDKDVSNVAATSSTAALLPPTILVGADYDTPTTHTTTHTTTRGGGGVTAVASHSMNNMTSSSTTSNNMTNTTTTTTQQLQQRLSSLKVQSSNLSSELTKRLATSRSGQSLLHIGPSLSTLPPDLSSLTDAITPLITDITNYESSTIIEYKQLIGQYNTINTLLIRNKYAKECSTLYNELVVAENIVLFDVEQRMKEVTVVSGSGSGSNNNKTDTNKKKEETKKKKKNGGGRGYSMEDNDDSDDDDDNDDDDKLDEGKDERMWVRGGWGEQDSFHYHIILCLFLTLHCASSLLSSSSIVHFNLLYI